MERLFRMSKKEIPTDTEGKLQQLRNDIFSDLPLDPIKGLFLSQHYLQLCGYDVIIYDSNEYHIKVW